MCTLATPKKKLLPLDDLHGFHPSLVHIAERWKRGQVACIQGIGSQNPNLSHFSSRDSWAAGSVKDVLPQTGWLGRHQEHVYIRKVVADIVRSDAAGDAEGRAGEGVAHG